MNDYKTIKEFILGIAFSKTTIVKIIYFKMRYSPNFNFKLEYALIKKKKKKFKKSYNND